MVVKFLALGLLLMELQHVKHHGHLDSNQRFNQQNYFCKLSSKEYSVYWDALSFISIIIPTRHVIYVNFLYTIRELPHLYKNYVRCHVIYAPFRIVHSILRRAIHNYLLIDCKSFTTIYCTRYSAILPRR